MTLTDKLDLSVQILVGVGLQREKLQQINQRHSNTNATHCGTHVYMVSYVYTQSIDKTDEHILRTQNTRRERDDQVTNILHHLEKVHNIPKHEVTEEVCKAI